MRTRAGYLAYGPWALILDLHLVSIYLTTAVSFSNVVCYPYSHLRSKLYDLAWPPGRRYYFTLGFLTALGHALYSTMGFLYLHRIPTSMDTTDPYYTIQRAGDYRAWVNGRLSLAFLNAVCAVLTMVDCAIFVRWDFDREMRDRAGDSVLQLRRWRAMFEEGESGHEGTMEAGVVHERPVKKEDDA